MAGFILFLFLFCGALWIFIQICLASANRTAEKIRQQTAPTVNMITSSLAEKGFHTTSNIALNYFSQSYGAPEKEIRVDSNSNKVAICDYNQNNFLLLDFTQILDCELVEDQKVVSSSSTGRAIAGAAIAGSTGAIVGAASAKDKTYINSLSIRLTTTNIDSPQIILETLESKIQKNDTFYNARLNHARKIYTIFNSIILSNKAKQE